jgi:hypothetical protein
MSKFTKKKSIKARPQRRSSLTAELVKEAAWVEEVQPLAKSMRHDGDTIIIVEKEPKPLPKGTREEQVKAFARLRKRPETLAIYDAILGLGEPLDLVTASNGGESEAITNDLLDRLMRYLEDHPSEVALVSRPLGTTPAFSPVLNIKEARKKMAVPKRASINAISGLCIRSIPGDILADVNFQFEQRALVFGPDVRDVAARIAVPMRGRRVVHGGQGDISWCDVNDRDWMKRIISSIIAPNFASSRPDRGNGDAALRPGWNDDRARAERDLIELLLQALLPMRKKLMASGAGLPMLAAALAQSDYRLTTALKGRKPALHRDRLIQFVAGELQRLGMSHVSIPIVEHR